MTCQRANMLTIPARLRFDVDNSPAAHLALQNLRREARQPGQRHDPGHPFEAIERQLTRQPLPRFYPFLGRAHHRIDAEQIGPAQQKRDHTRWQIAAPGQTAGGDTGAVFELGEDRRQCVAADRIDRAGPTLAIERP